MLNHRRAAAVAFLIGVLLVGAFAPFAAAASSLRVFATIGSNCIEGTAEPDSKVQVALLTGAGGLRAKFTTEADGDGDWAGCLSLLGFIDGVNPGDLLRLRSGGVERLVKVPNLIAAIDRVGDVISGRYLPGKNVTVHVLHGLGFDIIGLADVNSADLKSAAFSATTYTVKADGKGAFRLSLKGKVNLRGTDFVIVEGPADSSATGDHFVAIAAVPFLLVTANSARLSGWAVNTRNRYTLHDATGALKGRGSSNTLIFGLFLGNLSVPGTNKPAYPAPGDVLSANFAWDATLRIPKTALRGSASARTLSGRCMPNRPYQVRTDDGVYTGRTNGRGKFAVELDLEDPFEADGQLRLLCKYRTGDVLQVGATIDE